MQIDELDKVAEQDLDETVSFYLEGLRGIPYEEGNPDPTETVVTYRERIEKNLEMLDHRMRDFLIEGGNQLALVAWSKRLERCLAQMDRLDKNLAFRGRRQWNWEEVIPAMAFLEAVSKNADRFLTKNGIEVY